MLPLLPRPALVLFSYTTCALYLLEHAAWAVKKHEPQAEADVEVLRRWVDEGGFQGAVDEVLRSSSGSSEDVRARLEQNGAIVYGPAVLGQRSEGARARL